MLFIYFLAALHGAWGFQFPDEGWNSWPLQWEHGVLTTGLLGKSLYFVLFFRCVDLHLLKWKDVYKTVDFVMLDKDLTRFGGCSRKQHWADPLTIHCPSPGFTLSHGPSHGDPARCAALDVCVFCAYRGCTDLFKFSHSWQVAAPALKPQLSSIAQLCLTLQTHGLQHARFPCPSPTSRALLKLMSIESVMPSNHLIFCHPLLHPPSIFPSIRVFSNESVLLTGTQAASFNPSGHSHMFPSCGGGLAGCREHL